MIKESVFKEKAPFKPIRPKTANAKAAGLKSTFEIEGEVLMTSFGRGNDAVVDKSITGNEVKELNPSSKLKVTPGICYYNVRGNGKTTKAYSTNPASTKNVGEDLIGAKDVLEKGVLEELLMTIFIFS